MFDEPISPELALVDGGPAAGRAAEVEPMIDLLDARGTPATAAAGGTTDASSTSVEALLFQAGLITADQLGEVVRDSVLLNRSSVEVALERGLVSPAALQTLLAKTSASPANALPFPLPVEALPLQAVVVQAEAPLDPEGAAVATEQRSPIVPFPEEPTLEGDVHSVVTPAPPAPASPLPPEALLGLLGSMPTPATKVPEVDAAPLMPVARPDAAVDGAIPPVVPEQNPPAVLLPGGRDIVEADPFEPATPSAPPMVTGLQAEPTPTSAVTTFAVLVRLQTGERIAVDQAASFEAASNVARGLADRFAKATEWPFLSCRCIRPDAVVSVDIELMLEA